MKKKRFSKNINPMGAIACEQDFDTVSERCSDLLKTRLLRKLTGKETSELANLQNLMAEWLAATHPLGITMKKGLEKLYKAL
ncbi:MAG: hypothetical protein WCW14_01065 [Candidatus Paceibacterota bacterium]